MVKALAPPTPSAMACHSSSVTAPQPLVTDWQWQLALCFQAKPACDCLPQQHAIASRDPKQLGHPPDEVRLELVHDAIGHGNFPQHLDDLLAAILVELGAKDAGEPVE